MHPRIMVYVVGTTMVVSGVTPTHSTQVSPELGTGGQADVGARRRQLCCRWSRMMQKPASSSSPQALDLE